MSDRLNNEEFERLFASAVNYNFEEYLNRVPSKEVIKIMFPESERQKARKKQLISLERRLRVFDNIVLWTRRIAVSLAILFAVTFGILLTFSPEVRATVSETIVKRFEGFTEFRRSGDSTANIEYRSLQPEYLPTGFNEVNVFEFGDITQIFYENPNGDTIIFSYVLSEGAMVSANNENVDYHIFNIDGIDYHMFIATDNGVDNIILWYKDGMQFSVVSNIDVEELQAVAISVDMK